MTKLFYSGNSNFTNSSQDESEYNQPLKQTRKNSVNSINLSSSSLENLQDIYLKPNNQNRKTKPNIEYTSSSEEENIADICNIEKITKTSILSAKTNNSTTASRKPATTPHSGRVSKTSNKVKSPISTSTASKNYFPSTSSPSPSPSSLYNKSNSTKKLTARVSGKRPGNLTLSSHHHNHRSFSPSSLVCTHS